MDQASITGEFMPMVKMPGDEVFAGTVCKSGRMIIRAHKVGDETAAARIVHMVEEATHRKAQIQAYADRFSAQFIPLNFALAALVFGVTRSLTRAVNMLIIDYSCGIRLSTVTALSAAICKAARNGVLVKGSNYVELLSEADTRILDKTGTLTQGRPQVTSIIPLAAEIGSGQLVQYAAAAEETSAHPMAVAVVEKARRFGWPIPEHSDTEVHVSWGVQTRVNGNLVRVGSRELGIRAKGSPGFHADGSNRGIGQLDDPSDHWQGSRQKEVVPSPGGLSQGRGWAECPNCLVCAPRIARWLAISLRWRSKSSTWLSRSDR